VRQSESTAPLTAMYARTHADGSYRAPLASGRCLAGSPRVVSPEAPCPACQD